MAKSFESYDSPSNTLEFMSPEEMSCDNDWTPTNLKQQNCQNFETGISPTQPTNYRDSGLVKSRSPLDVADANSSNVGIDSKSHYEAKKHFTTTLSASNEQIETAPQSTFEKSYPPPHDKRPHLNIVFIGHVDAGKSTTCGNLLYLCGEVDARTIEKYEREAKEKNRETWFLAFIMDIHEEERQKGKTVEVGRAPLRTASRRYTILDAPGHKGFVPNMISGAAQADVAVLIVSARKGEFECGFEKGGQTREHAILAKTLGVNFIVVAVNKMDDPTCEWSIKRYESIEKKITAFLKTCGYNPSKDIYFIPISGLNGANLKDNVSDISSSCYCKEGSWYGQEKPTLLELLDSMPLPTRDAQKPLRAPLLEGFRDQGVMAVGKIEQGILAAGDVVTLMPNSKKLKIMSIFIEENEVEAAYPGENISMRVSGVEEDELQQGTVLCRPDNLCELKFDLKVQAMILELLENRPIITAGYKCVIHCHTATDEVSVTNIIESIDNKKKVKKQDPKFVKESNVVTMIIRLLNGICVDTYNSCPQMGRFTLRDEGKTIAVGKILDFF